MNFFIFVQFDSVYSYLFIKPYKWYKMYNIYYIHYMYLKQFLRRIKSKQDFGGWREQTISHILVLKRQSFSRNTLPVLIFIIQLHKFIAFAERISVFSNWRRCVILKRVMEPILAVIIMINNTTWGYRRQFFHFFVVRLVPNLERMVSWGCSVWFSIAVIDAFPMPILRQWYLILHIQYVLITLVHFNFHQIKNL